MSRQETLRHLRRFLVIGCSSVAVDALFYFLLVSLLGWNRNVAKGISYVLGMGVGFVGNKLWTFQSQRRSADEPLLYVVLYAITLLVNIQMNALALRVLGGFGLAKPTAFLFCTGITTVLNFLGMRFVTFRKGIVERRGQ